MQAQVCKCVQMLRMITCAYEVKLRMQLALLDDADLAQAAFRGTGLDG